MYLASRCSALERPSHVPAPGVRAGLSRAVAWGRAHAGWWPGQGGSHPTGSRPGRRLEAATEGIRAAHAQPGNKSLEVLGPVGQGLGLDPARPAGGGFGGRRGGAAGLRGLRLAQRPSSSRGPLFLSRDVHRAPWAGAGRGRASVGSARMLGPAERWPPARHFAPKCSPPGQGGSDWTRSTVRSRCCSASGDSYFVANYDASRGRLLDSQGRRTTATRSWRPPPPSWSRSGFLPCAWRTGPVLAEVAVRRGDLLTARRHLDASSWRLPRAIEPARRADLPG